MKSRMASTCIQLRWPSNNPPSMWSFIQILLLVACMLVDFLAAHPQCTDFRPPFRPAQSPRHCSRYAESGCCTGEQDAQLQASFSEFVARYDNSSGSDSASPLSQACKDELKNLQCLFCSPYAAHAFDVESSGERIDSPSSGRVPALCGSECGRLVQVCEVSVLNEFFGISPDSGHDDFCKSWTLSDVLYCYPNIREIEEELLTPRSTNTTASTNNSPGRTSAGQSDCLCVEVVADQLTNPLIFTSSRDETGRMFIGEQRGVIKILTRDGVILDEPFLDFSESVGTSDAYGDERGLLGLEFHPRYKDNGLFYTYYSEYTRQGQHYSRVSEWRRSESDPNRANLTSERRLLSIKQPRSNHNGGQVTFGPDGYLYIFSGDGGGAGDKFGERGNAQNL